MQTQTAFFVAALALAGAAATGAPMRIHVVPGGSDANPGTADRPLRTLERARDQIRALKKNEGLPPGGIVVELAGGRYERRTTFELTSADSGTPEAPIVYRSAPGERAWFHGGRDIPLAEFAPLTDTNLRQRIAEEAREHVRCLNLKEAGIRFYTRLPDRFNGYSFIKQTRRRPEAGFGYDPEHGYDVKAGFLPMEPFSNGKALPPARWPNQGFTHYETIVDPGKGRPGDSDYGGCVFTFTSAPGRLERWAAAEELILYGHWRRDYYGFSVRATAIDLEKSTVTLTRATLDRRSQRFYAQHLPEELDMPGEWYLHRSSGTLCLWPPAGAEAITFPVLEQPFVRMSGVSHVTLHGLGFEYTRHNAVAVDAGESNRVIACEVRRIGMNAVVVQGGRDHCVLGCDIHDTGHGGITLRGGDRKTLTASGHVAENNHIHHTSRVQRTHTLPLCLSGVGQRASHNLIHHTPHMAVTFKGNDHVMEYNEIYLVMMETAEGGVFYTGYDWTARGNIIRHNFIHHVTGAGHGGVRLAHLDDSASGTEMHGNISCRLEGGVSICGGNGNRIHDNLFIQCKRAVDIGPRGHDTLLPDGKGFCVAKKESSNPGMGRGLRKRLLAVPWNKPPYSTRYPELLQLFTKEPIAAPWFNVVTRNIAVDCGASVLAHSGMKKEWSTVEDNWRLGDPGFVEPERSKLDFRLKPDAEVYKQGFQRLQFGKVGLYQSPDRASWPVAPEPAPKNWKPRWLLKREAEGGLPVRIFPVAGIKEGRNIVIDGKVDPDEWQPPQFDATDPTRHRYANVRMDLHGREVAFPSQALIETDGDNLYVAFANRIDPKHGVTGGHRWGRNDAVEVSLARVPSPLHQGSEIPFTFRGYTDGFFESTTESGHTEDEARAALHGVKFAAELTAPDMWSAEWKIPLASIGVHLAKRNVPILAHLAVRNVGSKLWVMWRSDGGVSWRVHGGFALWLKPFGDLAFMPGLEPARVDVHVRPSRKGMGLRAGKGAEDFWWKGVNRVVFRRDPLLADRWHSFSFQFTSAEDGNVTLSLRGGGAGAARTWYDSIRIEGAELVNGDFELPGENGVPNGWRWQGKDPKPLTASSRAASGTSMAVVSSGGGMLNQSIAVTKGRTITVHLQARSAVEYGE